MPEKTKRNLEELESDLKEIRRQINIEEADESSAILEDLCYDEGGILDLIGAIKFSAASQRRLHRDRHPSFGRKARSDCRAH